MGQVIYMEQARIERENQLRNEALAQFPWKDMDSIRVYVIKPMVQKWSEREKMILIEAAFRLGYESFFLGLREGTARKKDCADLNAQETYRQYCSKQGERLVEKVINEFGCPQWLHSSQLSSVQVIFKSLTQDWVLKGLRKAFYPSSKT